MDAGALNVLHDSGDEGVLAVGDDVNFSLDAEQIFVDKDGLAGVCLLSLAIKSAKLLFVVDDLHGAPAKHKAGANENRVADTFGDDACLLQRSDSFAFRPWNAKAFEKRVELLAVFRLA